MAGIKNKIVQTYEECHRVTEDGELQKRCSIHDIYSQGEDPWFPCTDEYFYKSKNKTDCLGTWCKQCSVRKSMEWAEKNPEQYRITSIRKHKTPSTIMLHRKNARGQKESGYYADYIQKPEVKARKYGSRHRNHEISEKEWISCKDYFKDKDGDWSCAYCGKKIQDHWIVHRKVKMLGDFHKEHKDDKGANDLRNCLPACGECNSSKWSFEFEEWYREKEFFTEDRYNKIINWVTEDYKLFIEDRPPYRIIKKQNEHNKKFHHELWSVDELRNFVECLAINEKKKELEILLNELVFT